MKTCPYAPQTLGVCYVVRVLAVPSEVSVVLGRVVAALPVTKGAESLEARLTAEAVARGDTFRHEWRSTRALRAPWLPFAAVAEGGASCF